MIHRSLIIVALLGMLCALPPQEAGAAPKQASITIDASQTGEPISKYVYGQFIEHLGRCIYGGIWAEMLEDRKFYYPVTDEYAPWRVREDRGFFQGGRFPHLVASPWRVVGPVGSVTMTTDSPFVGDHDPEITLPGNGAAVGVEHGDLGLIGGKGYVGYAFLMGEEGAGPIEISLIWGEGEDERDTVVIESLTDEYRRYPFQFIAGADSNDAWLRITASGDGRFRIGTASIKPADNIEGFRADTLELLRQLDSPVYRWPGGNFVSGYDWRDGVGERDRRPPRTNPAWTGIEPNDVGMHEFIRLCELIDTEPFIAVNTGLGTVEEAAEQIEYCNGSIHTPMGAWRAANGHPEPFNVKWWAVGNEMYGSWQLGVMPLEDYIQKHNETAEAMWAIDPNAKLIAVGEVGEWSEGMMQYTADHMDLISEHMYKRDHEDLVVHVKQMVDGIKHIADAHRRYRNEFESLVGKDIRIAFDEWNYWYGRYVYGELGVQYYLQDALGVGASFHEMYRNSDLYFMANYAQTVNVIGAIKTSRTHAQWETTGLALKMYRKHYGEIPIKAEFPEPLDVAAAWTAERDAITISVVNPTMDAYELDLDISEARLQKWGNAWIITGEDRMDHNVPGEEMRVRIQEEDVRLVDGRLSVKPLSTGIYRFTAR